MECSISFSEASLDDPVDFSFDSFESFFEGLDLRCDIQFGLKILKRPINHERPGGNDSTERYEEIQE